MDMMTTKQLPTYFKFINSVKQNDVQQVAELLYEHGFLSHELERIMPETTLTPYLFSTQNQSMVDLTEVLVAFGANPKQEKPLSQEITPYQEIPLTQFVSDSSSLESPGLKLAGMLEKSLAEKKEEIIKKYHLDCIQKLYILTGARPFTCDRTLHKDGTKGTHLRFVMPHLEKPQVDTILKLFNIPFNDGFGSQTHSYISILPKHYRVIDLYFESQDLLKTPNFSIDDFPDENKTALCNILFSTKFLAALENRNYNQYSLERIMLFLASFTMKNSLCFEYLEEKGHAFKHVAPSSQMLHFSAHSPLNREKASPYSAEPANLLPNQTNESSPLDPTDTSKKRKTVTFQSK